MHAPSKAAVPATAKATVPTSATTPGERGRCKGHRRAEHNGSQSSHKPFVHLSLHAKLWRSIPPQEQRSGERNRSAISND
jgi:hypothetical protein